MRYRFGPFELDEADRRLTRDGEMVPLQPKPFDLLLLLLERRGHLVTKDSILDALWPDVVVTEASLAQCVRLLRMALGDARKHARYIETVPRLGYRFMAEVVPVDPTETAPEDAPAETKTRAIMVSDICDFSAMLDHDLDKTLAILQEHYELIEPIIAAHRGRVVKHISDSTLSAYESATDAVHCAIEVQRALRVRNRNKPDGKILIRIGVHIGDVVMTQGDVFGPGVNIAALIEPLAEPGGICISQTVYDMVRARPEIQVVHLGAKKLTRMREAVSVHKVVVEAEQDDPEADAPHGESETPLPPSAALDHRPVIAVLPFVNMSPDAANEYFADGLCEEVLNVLAKIPDLRVVARTSSFSLEGRNAEIAEVAARLGATHVLEGSVRVSGERVRVTTQLIDAADSLHLWSETYERNLADTFVIEDDIAKAVAGALQQLLFPNHPPRTVPNPDPEATESVPAPGPEFSPRRIAVLPFEDFSPTGDQQFLGDGIADTLLRTFAELEELSVIARTSSFYYRGRAIASVARDFEVGTVVEGSVQRIGDRLRIVARLIRTHDQSQIWSFSVDREAGDIFAIQDEIAQQVANALLGSDAFRRDQRASPEIPVNVYDRFLEARTLSQSGRTDGIQRAVDLLEEVIALAPDYGPAYSELARVLGLLGETTVATHTALRPRLDALVARALELNPSDADAYAVRGIERLLHDGDVVGAREDLERAVALRPNDARHLGSLALVLSYAGDMRAAGRYRQRAFELDPMDVSSRTGRLRHLLAVDEWDEAMRLARQTVRLFPEDTRAWYFLGEVQLGRGNVAGFVLTAVDAFEHVDAMGYWAGRLARGFNLLGEFELADRWLERAHAIDERVFVRRSWYIARGDFDSTLALAREEIARDGDNPGAQRTLGEALIAAGHWGEARGVLEALVGQETGGAADDRSGLDPFVHLRLAWLVGQQGDAERAATLIAEASASIERIVSGWPESEAFFRFELDVAASRAAQASQALDSDFARDPRMYHDIAQLPWYADVRSDDGGRTYLAAGEREFRSQLAALQEAGIPWLFEPERWIPAGSGNDPGIPSIRR